MKSVVNTPKATIADASGTTVLSSITATHGAAWTPKRLNRSSYITERSLVAYDGTTVLLSSEV